MFSWFLRIPQTTIFSNVISYLCFENLYKKKCNATFLSTEPLLKGAMISHAIPISFPVQVLKMAQGTFPSILNEVPEHSQR